MSSDEVEPTGEEKEKAVPTAADDSESGAGRNVCEGTMNGKQHWINGKWVFRCAETGSLATYDADAWVGVPEDDAEFLEQLWMEAEAAEKQKGAGDGAEVNEDFIANYQASYGVQYDYSSMKKPEAATEKQEKKEEVKKRKHDKNAPKQPVGWVDMEEKVHAVYVSGLPLDVTTEEFTTIMSKCGVIQNDARTNKPKIKLYTDEEGNVKGDGRCCYIHRGSVALALDILHESDVRGKKIKVEVAHFEMKGQFDPTKKRRKLTNAQKKKYMEQQNKMFEWKPDKPRNYRPLSDCTVVIKQLFTLDELNEDASRIFSLKNEVNESCAAFGVVKKVTMYENNPEGVATVVFENTVESDKAVTMLNGRIVRGRTLQAALWDGKTRYKVEESEEDARKRLEKWNEYMEGKGKQEGEAEGEGAAS